MYFFRVELVGAFLPLKDIIKRFIDLDLNGTLDILPGNVMQFYEQFSELLKGLFLRGKGGLKLPG